jgi:hypothetical protein
VTTRSAASGTLPAILFTLKRTQARELLAAGPV